MTKNYLDGKKIAYTYVNIDEDQEAAKQLVERTGQVAIPVIEVGSTTIIGFDRPKLDEALKANHLVK